MHFKLLIFDLDDTLIDTFGTSSPLKLSEALQTMIEVGLVVHSLNQALKRIIEIDQKSTSVKNTIRDFVKENLFENKKSDSIKDLSEQDLTLEIEKYSSIGIKKYYEEFTEGFKSDCQLKAVEGALEILPLLQKKYTLAIVSKGLEKTQYWKLQKTGIDQKWFKKIIVVSEEKKSAYESLMKDNKCLPSEVLVCGDKYELDLLPAKELGLTTIYFKWGRAKNNILPKNIVDYSIENIKEILDILESPQKSQK